MNNELAIVIPAYKAKFLSLALSSVCNQTNKNFVLYVCDDGSPENLEQIVDLYRDYIPINYIRFDKNLGGQNLIEHWNRSVQLAEAEWVWLFSDDDIMPSDCVEAFYNVLARTAEVYNVYRFNIEMIDSSGKIICKKENHPEIESGIDFLKRRLNSESLSAAIEYVFRKEVFVAMGGFVNFSAAVCADDASWIKFSEGNGIYTISSPVIYWRSSGINISSKRGLHQEKVKAYLQFIDWVHTEFKESREELNPMLSIWFLEVMRYVYGRFYVTDILRIAYRVSRMLNESTSRWFLRLLRFSKINHTLFQVRRKFSSFTS